jgi:hypothetical protein
MPALVLCSAGNFGSFLLASQPESGELIHSPVATSPGNLAGLAVIASVNDFMLNRTPDPEQLSPIDPSLNPACTMSVSASLSKGDSFPTPPRPVPSAFFSPGLGTPTGFIHSKRTGLPTAKPYVGV